VSGTGERRATIPQADLLLFGLLFLAVVLTRLPFRSDILYSWDSVNYAFGMRRFDVLTEQPQPPGYIAYVWLARLVDAVTGSANTAMMAISIAAGAAAVVALYLLGRRLFDQRAGLVAAVLLATSPLFWFYGEIALPHTLDAALVLFALWLLFRVRRGERQSIWAAAVVLAIAGGVRPQTLVFLLPVTVFSVWRADWRRIAGAAILGAAVCCAWFYPLIHSVGGLQTYLDKLSSYATRFETSTSLLRGAGLPGLEHNVGKLVAFTLFASAAAFLPLALYAVLRLARRLPSAPAAAAADEPALGAGATPGATGAAREQRVDRIVFLALWGGPVLFYYAFIHMGQQGMILTFFPIVTLLAGTAATRIWTDHRLWLWLAVLGALNAGVFVAMPQQPPGLRAQHLPVRAAIVANDAYFSKRFAYIAGHLPAESTTIVAGNWRHVEYYLPSYRLLRLGADADPDGAGRPRQWPGAGTLTPADLNPQDAGGQPTLVLFDAAGSDLFRDLPGVETIAWPGAGSLKLYRLPPRTSLDYSGAKLRVVPQP